MSLLVAIVQWCNGCVEGGVPPVIGAAGGAGALAAGAGAAAVAGAGGGAAATAGAAAAGAGGGGGAGGGAAGGGAGGGGPNPGHPQSSVNRDGSVTTTYDDDRIDTTSYRDGKRVTEFRDGRTTTVYGNGAVDYDKAFPDGSTTSIHLDPRGNEVFRTHTEPPGGYQRSTDTLPDGTRIVTRSDGSRVQVNTDRSAIYEGTDPAGNHRVVSVDPTGRQTGDTTTFPDGSKIITGPQPPDRPPITPPQAATPPAPAPAGGGRRPFAGFAPDQGTGHPPAALDVPSAPPAAGPLLQHDGSLVTPGPGGTHFVHRPDGAWTQHGPSGVQASGHQPFPTFHPPTTQVVHQPDGSVAVTHPNGVRELWSGERMVARFDATGRPA